MELDKLNCMLTKLSKSKCLLKYKTNYETKLTEHTLNKLIRKFEKKSKKIFRRFKNLQITMINKLTNAPIFKKNKDNIFMDNFGDYKSLNVTFNFPSVMTATLTENSTISTVTNIIYTGTFVNDDPQNYDSNTYNYLFNIVGNGFIVDKKYNINIYIKNTNNTYKLIDTAVSYSAIATNIIVNVKKYNNCTLYIEDEIDSFDGYITIPDNSITSLPEVIDGAVINGYTFVVYGNNFQEYIDNKPVMEVSFINDIYKFITTGVVSNENHEFYNSDTKITQTSTQKITLIFSKYIKTDTGEKFIQVANTRTNQLSNNLFWVDPNRPSTSKPFITYTQLQLPM
jgi:hypothetical protein